MLCLQVTKAQSEVAGDGGEEGENGDDDDDGLEFLYISDHVSYLYPLLRLLAFLHTFVAFSMMVAYNCLKVIHVYISQGVVCVKATVCCLSCVCNECAICRQWSFVIQYCNFT